MSNNQKGGVVLQQAGDPPVLGYNPANEVSRWIVSRSMPIQGVPRGLEHLISMNRLIIEDQGVYVEAFPGWEKNNKYLLKNSAGQYIYLAAEKTDTFMRICCKQTRGFVIHIVDYSNQECLRITREFKFCAGCSWCAGCCDGCAYEVKVETPAGQVMGYVRQKGSFWKAQYDILDANRETVMKIQGPCCICGPCCPCDYNFEITSLDGISRGRVTKKYTGFVKAIITKEDNFMIEFSQDLSVATKATLLGALFLIDFMFFPHNDDAVDPESLLA